MELSELCFAQKSNLFKMRYVLLSLCLFMAVFLSAQRFNATLFGGLTSSQISGDGAYGFVQFGGILGSEVYYSFNDTWTTSFGLRFNQKGSRIYKSATSVDVYRLRVNYVEAPFLVHYSLNRFSFGAGPVVGVKVNQRERTQFGVVENPREFDRVELGLEVNIDYQLRDKWNVRLLFQNSALAVRDHPIDQAFPPALFVLGTLHQKMLNQGQYFTSLSLVLTYQL